MTRDSQNKWRNKTSPRRHSQVCRILKLAEYIREDGDGQSTKDIAKFFRERTGAKDCERTIRRDLTVLETIGAIVRDDDWHYSRPVWRWAGFSMAIADTQPRRQRPQRQQAEQ